MQFEFYYSRLGQCRQDIWETACGLFAGGEKWPSADEIRHSINASLPPRLQLTHHPEAEEKPELLVKIEAYRKLAVEQPVGPGQMTILEAAEAVWPGYEKENPGPKQARDIKLCHWLIKKQRAFRAHMQARTQSLNSPRGMGFMRSIS
jgi:hypothetical protein